MKNHETIGALCLLLVRAYTSAACSHYPVTLKFKPFYDSKGCVREQLRVQVALFVHRLCKVVQEFDCAMPAKHGDVLAIGFMQYPVWMEDTSPELVAVPSCTLIFCMPDLEKEGERFDVFMHARKEELLRASRSITDFSVGPALEEDVDVEVALYDPIVNGSVSASDLVLATHDSIYRWNHGKMPPSD